MNAQERKLLSARFEKTALICEGAGLLDAAVVLLTLAGCVMEGTEHNLAECCAAFSRAAVERIDRNAAAPNN